MAQQPHGSTSPGSYDPEMIYDVRLSRTVMVGRARIKPLGGHQMTGATLNAIVDEEGADAIVSANPR
jgi:lipopolysaccharide export system protein LptA